MRVHTPPHLESEISRPSCRTPSLPLCPFHSAEDSYLQEMAALTEGTVDLGLVRLIHELCWPSESPWQLLNLKEREANSSSWSHPSVLITKEGQDDADGRKAQLFLNGTVSMWQHRLN